MGLETATYISELNAANPVGATDPKSQGDDHLRLLKSVLQAQFPNFTAAAVNATVVQLNLLNSLTAVSVLGRPEISSGGVSAIAAGSDTVLRRSGTSALDFGKVIAAMLDGSAVTTAKVADDAITNAKLNNMGAATVKGRASGAGTGDPVDLSASQLITILLAADGAGSGLDADLLDGQHGSFYRNATNMNAGILNNARLNAPTVWGQTQRNTSSAIVAGRVNAVTSNITYDNNDLAAGEMAAIYNNSASDITITQGASTTLRLAGTTSTGNRTLAPRGFATLWANTGSEVVCAGAGIS